MNQLRMTAVSAILLAANLSHGFARWACLVDHSVLGLAFSDLCPDYDYFFLRYSDRFVTPGTEITAQSETSANRSSEVPKISSPFVEEPFLIALCKLALQLRQRS
jgi:hypothetical protein